MIDIQETIQAAKAGELISAVADDGRHDLLVDYPTVRVVDRDRGTTVAYSSMRADFESSLEEFVHDYLGAA